MNRSAIIVAAGILGASMAVAQTQSPQKAPTAQMPAPAQTQANAENLPAGAPIDVALNKSLNAKKAKPGDPVTARVTQNTETNGKVIIPEGARLEGHVTAASARSKGDANSSLGIVFDKAVLKHGETVPVNVSVQAIALPQSEATAQNGSNTNMDAMSSTPSAGMGRGAMASQPQGQMNPNPAPGSYGAAPSTSNTTTISGGPGAVGGLNAQGQLTANSKGVFGLPGVELASGAAASESAKIISTGKDLHLDGGTQMLLLTRAANASEKPKS
jgi:hypothetical protein